MTFINYKGKNNAETTFDGDVGASTTTWILKTWEGALFGTSYPFLLTAEKFNTSTPAQVIWREIVKVTDSPATDQFTVERQFEECVQDETANPKVLANGPQIFDSWDKISLYETAWDDKDVKDEVTRLEAAKLDLAWWNLTWLVNTSKAFNLAKSGNIASDTETDLATATGNEVHITWTEAIESFWTIQAWAEYTLIFDGILTLTYNWTSLILPTGANIDTQVGDVVKMVSEWSGNWKCTSYEKADGSALSVTTWDTPEIFWDWSDGALLVESWTEEIALDTIHQYTNLQIDVWAVLSTAWTNWQLIIKVNWTLTLNWDIDITGIDSEEHIDNQLGIAVSFWASGNWGNWWTWGSWTSNSWKAWWSWTDWYGWGWGWGWGRGSSQGAAWWDWWAPWGSWWAFWHHTTNAEAWGNSAWWGWAWYHNSPYNWGAWWDAYGDNWGNASSGWGWGAWAWEKWGTPLVLIFAKAITWNGNIIADWWDWSNWWTWGNWGWDDVWGGWGWGWGAGWGWGWVIAVFGTNWFTGAYSIVWGALWTGWAWGTWEENNWAAWSNWTAWSSWNTNIKLLSEVI